MTGTRNITKDTGSNSNTKNPNKITVINVNSSIINVGFFLE